MQKKPRKRVDKQQLVLDELCVLNNNVCEIVRILRDDVPLNKSNGEDRRGRVDTMFDALGDADLPRTTEAFIDSLRDGYRAFGSLTERQFSALERNYKRFV